MANKKNSNHYYKRKKLHRLKISTSTCLTTNNLNKNIILENFLFDLNGYFVYFFHFLFQFLKNFFNYRSFFSSFHHVFVKLLKIKNIYNNRNNYYENQQPFSLINKNNNLVKLSKYNDNNNEESSCTKIVKSTKTINNKPKHQTSFNEYHEKIDDNFCEIIMSKKQANKAVNSMIYDDDDDIKFVESKLYKIDSSNKIKTINPCKQGKIVKLLFVCMVKFFEFPKTKFRLVIYFLSSNLILKLSDKLVLNSSIEFFMYHKCHDKLYDKHKI
jgi:hypothetical protein